MDFESALHEVMEKGGARNLGDVVEDDLLVRAARSGEAHLFVPERHILGVRPVLGTLSPPGFAGKDRLRRSSGYASIPAR